ARRQACGGDRRLRSLDAGRLIVRPAALLLPFVFALTACENEAPEPQPVETEIPDELAQDPPPVIAAEDSIGTPMAERVATLGLLNKRNNISQDLEMRPGESRRVGNVIVRL